VLTKGANVGALLSSYRPKQTAKPKVKVKGEGEVDETVRVELIKGDVRKEFKF
jgi:hypothetical protein